MTPCSLLNMARVAATTAATHQPRLAARTAASSPAATSSSARETTLATPSTWTGCTANTSPAATAPIRRQPALEYQHHEHADDAVEDGIDEMEPRRRARAQLPVHGVGEDGDGTIQSSAGRRRPVRLVEGADRRGDRVRSGAVCDDAAVVLQEAVPYRRQKQADGDEEHQGKAHRASQTRAHSRRHSAVAVSPRKRAALAWTRR